MSDEVSLCGDSDELFWNPLISPLIYSVCHCCSHIMISSV